MTDLKIGGYKNKGSEFSDIVINPTESTETVEPVVEPQETTDLQEPVEPVTPEGTPEPAEPVEPVTPEGTPEPAEPVVTPQQNRSSLSFDNPDNDDLPNGVSDEDFYRTLSEKLGKPIKDLSEISNNTVNPIDNDPYLKNLVEWRNKTGRPIEDWIKFQKDYDSMSDTNVAREILQYKYPTLTEEELDIEMLNYTPDEDDYETDVAKKKLELKKLASEGRNTLNQLKSSFNDPLPIQYSPEVQEDLKLAQKIKEHIALDEADKMEYQQNVKNISNKLNTFTIPLTDDFTLNYKISEESKSEIPNLIDTMPHWKNEDGTTNYEAIVTDAIKIKHFDEIVKLIYNQGIDFGKEQLLKETNNVNLNEPSPSENQPHGRKGVVIEGLDTYMGNRGMKIRTKNN